MRNKLTDKFIKSTKPTSRTQRFSDGENLYLLIEPTGSKRWRFRYVHQKKEKTLSLGIYPRTSLKEARDKRDECFDLLKQGIDPSAHRKEQKDIPDGYHPNAFELVARKWIALKIGTWGEATKKKTIARLENEVFPYIGKRNVNEIATQDVLEVLTRIIKRGYIETANRIRGSIGEVFTFAVTLGFCDKNPASNLSRFMPSHKKKHMPSFTNPTDASKFLHSFGLFRGSFQTLCALKLSVLWFVRPSELRLAKWCDFDLETKEWRFVVSKTKTPHIVPLSKQAIAILKELQPLTGSGEYVFSMDRKRPMSDGTVNKAIRQLGWCTKTQFTGHGVRAMARTLLAERLKIRSEIIEHQLAHRVPDLLGTAYNRTKFIDDRRAMMQVWADYVDELRATATNLNA
jgi:integrase